MLKALKEGQTDRAMAVAQSMVLPDPAAWYHQTFGNYSGGKEIASYTNQRPQLPAEIFGFFKKAMQSGNTGIHVKRFDANCDDNDGENTFPTLDARVNAAPLYDLRLYNGDRYFRLWPLAYIDGAFRFVGEPHPWDYFSPRLATDSPAASAKNPADQHGEEPATLVRQSGGVVAARLLKRVTPQYPETARGERLQGNVRLHAIIGADGTITRLRVMNGYCSLARASLDAVKQWRYSPTILLGKPVEVDTTIDVIFTLEKR
jgi:TonB family protein